MRHWCDHRFRGVLLLDSGVAELLLRWVRGALLCLNAALIMLAGDGVVLDAEHENVYVFREPEGRFVVQAWPTTANKRGEFQDVTDAYQQLDAKHSTGLGKAREHFQKMLGRLFNCDIDIQDITVTQKKDCFHPIPTPVLVGTPSVLSAFLSCDSWLRRAWGIWSVSETGLTYLTGCCLQPVKFAKGYPDQEYWLYMRGSHGAGSEIPLPMIIHRELAEKDRDVLARAEGEVEAMPGPQKSSKLC